MQLTSGERASLNCDTIMATAVGMFILDSCMPTQLRMPLPKGVKRFACAPGFCACVRTCFAGTPPSIATATSRFSTV